MNPFPDNLISPGEPAEAPVDNSWQRRIRELEYEVEFYRQSIIEARSNHSNMENTDASLTSIPMTLYPRSSLEQRQRWLQELETTFDLSPHQFLDDTRRINLRIFQ
jgi:hypothetical protein